MTSVINNNNYDDEKKSQINLEKVCTILISSCGVKAVSFEYFTTTPQTRHSVDTILVLCFWCETKRSVVALIFIS